MKPIEFPEQSMIIAKDQPEYIPLPAHIADDGQVTSCWAFTFRERVRILFGAKLYWTQLTFGKGLQPVKPDLDWKPETLSGRK